MDWAVDYEQRVKKFRCLLRMMYFCIKFYFISRIDKAGMSDHRQSDTESSRSDDRKCLRLHHKTIALLYAVALFVSCKVLSWPEAQKDLVTLLSTGAILATFGSAIGAVGLIWQDDLLERIRLNVDILYRDIVKQQTPWRRWPFLERAKRQKLLDGGSLHHDLRNPQVSLDVGTHIIKADLPTVMGDFFDLPLVKNYWQLWRFRKAAHTVFGKRKDDLINPETGMTPSDGYMAYECMFDIWKSVFRFRLARYIIHFGSGLTVFGALIVAVDVVMR